MEKWLKAVTSTQLNGPLDPANTREYVDTPTGVHANLFAKDVFRSRSEDEMNAIVERIGFLAAFLAGIISVCCHMQTRAADPTNPKAMTIHTDQPERTMVSSWNQKGAAAYLDRRQSWWMD